MVEAIRIVATFNIMPKNLELGGRGCLKGNRFWYSSKAGSEDRFGSRHPTVKPIDLMKWLVALVTPKDGLVLDPFAGSGTTGVAGDSVIIVQANYKYSSLVQYIAPSIATQSKLGFARPRGNSVISCTAACL